MPGVGQGSSDPLLLAFEGGGAKGILHVGALAEIERRWPDRPVAACAGASAGALVAGLVAAGWRADDIVDDEGRSAVLEAVGVRCATELIPRWGLLALLVDVGSALISSPRALLIGGALLATPFRLFPRLDIWMGQAQAWLAILGLFLAAPPLLESGIAAMRDGVAAARRRARANSLGLAAVGALGGLAAASWSAHVHIVATALLGLTVLIVLLLFWAPGVADARERLVEKLDAALAEGIRRATGKTPTRPVTFEALFERRQVGLRLVATDYDTGLLQVFSEKTTPRAQVAEAMAASAAIPLAFRPVVVFTGRSEPRPRRYCDGGMVSNLPVWALDDFRESYPDALTVILGIGADRNALAFRRSASLSGWLRLFRRALFGARVLETRGLFHCVQPLELSTEVGVLQFDLPRPNVGRMRRNASESAATQFGFADKADELQEFFFGELIAAFYDKFIHEKQNRKSRRLGPNQLARKIRAHISSSSFGEEVTRIVASSAPPRDGILDDRLALPVDGSLVSESLDRKKPLFRRFEEGVAKFPDPMGKDRYREPLVWNRLRWSLSTPLIVAFAEGSPLHEHFSNARQATTEAQGNWFGAFRGRVRRSALIIDGADEFPAWSDWARAVPDSAQALLANSAKAAIITLAYRHLKQPVLDVLERERWPI